MSVYIAKCQMTYGEYLQEIVREMAGDYAYGSIHGDSTGFGIYQYVQWEDAKRGATSRHNFVKLHLLTGVHGKIVTFTVTPGTTHDSPMFQKMCKYIPNGSGYITLDSAYDSGKNCDLIVQLNRVPVIKPRKNCIARGYSTRAKMIRWYIEQYDDFMYTYGKRNLAESVFACIKKKWGSMTYAKNIHTQTVEMFARVLCYNLTIE